MNEGKMMKYSNFDKVKDIGDELITLLKAKAAILAGKNVYVSVDEGTHMSEMTDVAVDRDHGLAAIAQKEKDLRFALSELNVDFDMDDKL